ncbi:MAG: penicillin-binding protein 1C, partial [Anaerolineales bacterium]|nr:penicillin-binding protein 1C [Anaerolineales bacterium]
LAAWHYLVVDLPSLERLTQNLAPASTKILARDGRLLYEIADPAGTTKHTTLPLSEIPLHLQQAVIATEDATFYTNPGVDVVGIVRAIWINLTGGEVLAGGSTITQQVARNMLLDPEERAERTLTRKLRESILAWRLAQAYTKDQILELYLNQTYYGHLAYGVEAAAQTYFGKSARDLDLAEAALIAGLPQAPSLYDPLLYPDKARQRQAVVLDLMVKQGYITAEEARLAKDEQLRFASTAFPIEAPHFVFYVWNLLEQKYGPEVLYSGLVVTTTLDLDLTRAAEAIVRRRLQQLADDRNGPAHNATGAALVALDPRTGQVLAMLGSPNYFDASISGAINMAVAPRQPGSAIKPITYAAAFSPELCNLQSPISGAKRSAIGDCPWTPATMILDVHTAFVTKEGFSYVPQNYDRTFHGPVSARDALAGSLNVPAVIALDHVGLPTMLRLASRMGLTTLSDADRFGLALTLGGGEVRLLDLTSAFGVFANGGVRVTPTVILEVSDARGNLIERWQPRAGERVLDERVAFLITDILSDNEARAATFGLNSVLRIGRPAAVKTGTTTDYRDNWTVGYTPELAVGVWVGNANFTPMVNLSGVSGAGPIWHDFMRRALAGKPETTFTPPPGLTRVEVCVPSGRLPTPLCPRTRLEWFLEEAVPTEPDTLYREIKLDVRTGQPADATTPPEAIVTQVVMDLPPAAREWALANGIPQPPVTHLLSSNLQSSVFIASPDPQTVFQISPRLPRESQRVPFRVYTSQPLSEVTFLLNDRPVGTLTESPFEWWWPLAPGTFRLQAQA